MLPKRELPPPILAIARYLEQCEDVAAAYLFGSQAKGTGREKSDIDVAVLFYNQKDKLSRFDRRVEMIIDLERAVGRKVDIVDMEEAPLMLRHQILKNGILLVNKKPTYRVSFEVKSRRAFFDLRPVLLRRGRQMIARVLEGKQNDGQ